MAQSISGQDRHRPHDVDDQRSQHLRLPEGMDAYPVAFIHNNHEQYPGNLFRFGPAFFIFLERHTVQSNQCIGILRRPL